MPLFGNDPRKFIRHNAIQLDGSLSLPDLRIVRRDRTVLVKLVASEGLEVTRNRNRKGMAKLLPRSKEKWWTKPSALYYVVPVEEGEEGTPAYICPYKANCTCPVMLEGNADVMFTAMMTGCTFGVGVPNNNGGVRVAHANAMEQAVYENDILDVGPQLDAQLLSLQHYEMAAQVLEPEQYNFNAAKGYRAKGGNYMAALIGLRIKGVWEFWYQHQATDSFDSDMTLREKMATVKLQ